jgi:hypothetical protein
VAISVLDARDTPVVPARVPGAPPAVRRLPAAVLGVAVISVLEAVTLLAGSLAGIDGALSASPSPHGLLVGVALVTLAGWIVGCAGGAAALVDGAGRRLLQWVAYGELALAGVLFAVALLTADLDALLPAALPLPAVALLVFAVPVGKLLLAGAPTTLQFLEDGPRPRERRADPTKVHQDLCVATLVIIGLVLGVVALVGPSGDAGGTGSTTAVTSTR